jgi:hypothetical protein
MLELIPLWAAVGDKSLSSRPPTLPPGRKIDGRRVLVDVERGRTVKGWKPRKLGGGLGGTRKAPGEQGAEPPVKTTSYSDR